MFIYERQCGLLYTAFVVGFCMIKLLLGGDTRPYILIITLII